MKPVLLVVLDGFGLRDEREHNAVRLAKTPTFDQLFAHYPWTTLQASGSAVGLPEGQMGNSEVGHLNLGAGRVVHQDIVRISRSIKDESFFANPVLLAACQEVRKSGGRLHIMGLCSDGGVHSLLSHGLALVELARRNHVEPILHAFLDGRDTPPKSARPFLEMSESKARVATVSGRYYAMDRDKRWDRIELAWQALVQGKGLVAKTALEALESAYARGETDEFVRPTVVDAKGCLRDGDAVVFFNFRADRARQLMRALTLDDFDGFARPERPRLSASVCMTTYDRTFALPVAFGPQKLPYGLGEVISTAGLKQFRAAETEKYAHVTYFFNGGVETPFSGEERYLVPSDRGVATYDARPEMSAPAVAQVVCRELQRKELYFGLVNFANPDMVGHTGKLEPTIRAVECVDQCLQNILHQAEQAGWAVLITADHGNCELMLNQQTGQAHTAHTTEPVPLWLVDDEMKGARLTSGSLCDVAPTVLWQMGLEKPKEMTGRALVEAYGERLG